MRLWVLAPIAPNASTIKLVIVHIAGTLSRVSVSERSHSTNALAGRRPMEVWANGNPVCHLKGSGGPQVVQNAGKLPTLASPAIAKPRVMTRRYCQLRSSDAHHVPASTCGVTTATAAKVPNSVRSDPRL